MVQESGIVGVDRAAHAYWDRLAEFYSSYVEPTAPSELVGVLQPYLASSKTLIDVGCGPGVHIAELAPQLAAVTGIEPSASMRQRIPQLPNVRVIGEIWENVRTEPADIVLSSLVLNFVCDAVAFIEKMEAHAREWCFLHLLDDDGGRPTDALFTLLTGRARPRSPRFRDAYNVLREIGIRPFVTPLSPLPAPRWLMPELALADCKARMGPYWQDAVGTQWLLDNLTVTPRGVTLGKPRPTAVAFWQPRG